MGEQVVRWEGVGVDVTGGPRSELEGEETRGNQRSQGGVAR